MADDEGAGSQEGVEVTTSPASTSASSSTSDLPCIAPPEAERHAGGRRHSSRSFTGLRLFGRRVAECPHRGETSEGFTLMETFGQSS
ncbi:hypothetical protein KOW79_021400 [Hemibagrus wyckioides]|uniref:Uncharacterized protein n=1 Tax=Hemibagrus wyckioides TaxID=337641 RepID=A0A9D3N3V4_9TELE|nr:hypothetical protein KOW79_021400 [Hemibagrus wyckioides]